MKNRCVTDIKTLLSSLAEKYNSNSHYFIHEIEGHSNVQLIEMTAYTCRRI